MAAKLPNLTEHLEKCDIDLATVTLNWFLALFFDAVPFQVTFYLCMFYISQPQFLHFLHRTTNLYSLQILTEVTCKVRQDTVET